MERELTTAEVAAAETAPDVTCTLDRLAEEYREYVRRLPRVSPTEKPQPGRES